MNNGVTERSSDSETFLFKFGIEPMNPDGTKFGGPAEVTRWAEQVERSRRLIDSAWFHNPWILLGRAEKLVSQNLLSHATRTATPRERAVVDEKCPKCSHKGLNFYCMQLRSVDEGQTVFYECPKVGGSAYKPFYLSSATVLPIKPFYLSNSTCTAT
jgi:DNA-directed RNA polymerase subunit M/transcription elongation factor TFIIS